MRIVHVKFHSTLNVIKIKEVRVFTFILLFKRFYKIYKIIRFYTTLTNLSTAYPVMCKVYTDVGGMK